MQPTIWGKIRGAADSGGYGHHWAQEKAGCDNAWIRHRLRTGFNNQWARSTDPTVLYLFSDKQWIVLGLSDLSDYPQAHVCVCVLF